jgi:hypothetical protein
MLVTSLRCLAQLGLLLILPVGLYFAVLAAAPPTAQLLADQVHTLRVTRTMPHAEAVMLARIAAIAGIALDVAMTRKSSADARLPH